MITRACARCSQSFETTGKTRYCSDACRCGTDAGYNRGCRCVSCTRAHSRARNIHRMGVTPWVPAIGTHRRIQALARLGWSSAELSRRLGRHRSYLRKVLTNDYLETPTVAAVRALYDELSMTLCTSPTATRTASDARRRGWPPPLGWDDIDDPNEQPTDWEYDGPDRAEILTDVLARGGNTYEACRVLGLSRDSLHTWCSNNHLKHLFRALAAREVTVTNGYTADRDLVAS